MRGKMKDQEQQQKQPGSQFQRDFRLKGLPCGSAGKESACNAGDLGSISGLGRSPGEGKLKRTTIATYTDLKSH